MISGPRNTREQILCPTRESDQFMRKHRTANDQLVVVEDHPIQGDRDELAQQTTGHRFNLRSADRADGGQGVGAVPGLIENVDLRVALGRSSAETPTSRSTASAGIGGCVPSAIR